MTKYLSTIGTFAFIFAAFFDKQLAITSRLNAGTLINDVERVHTIMVNGQLFTSQPEVNANMSHLRHLSVCSVTPQNCKGQSTVWDN